MAGCTHYLHEQFPDNLRHDRVLKIQIIDAMRRVGNPAIPTLLQTLADSDVAVRKAACEALGAIRDPTSVPSLVCLLADSNSDIRTAAATALGRIGKVAIPALLQALESDSGRIRAAACSALGEIRDPTTMLY
jgi:HEAT repeat protein